MVSGVATPPPNDFEQPLLLIIYLSSILLCELPYFPTMATESRDVLKLLTFSNFELSLTGKGSLGEWPYRTVVYL